MAELGHSAAGRRAATVRRGIDDLLVAANVRLRAEITRRTAEARDARLRLVSAADTERRRIERDLHDGAQQTLVSLALTVEALRERLDAAADPQARALADRSAELALRALGELRDLARGVYPVSLADSGIPGALQTLAASAPVPVGLDVDVPGRLEPAAEAAGYFVCAEAVTNAVKHAGAKNVTVSARWRDGELTAEVVDDGRGGAEERPGGGLAGLADRAAALGGVLDVRSPAGAGTAVSVRIPAPLRAVTGTHA